MAAVEVAIAGHPAVLHLAVERRAQVHAARPVLGRQHPLDRREVHVGHMDQAAAPQRARSPLAIAEPHRPLDDPVLEIELLAVVEDVDRFQGEGFAALRLEGQTRPVRPVDQILVLDDATGDLGLQAIVAASQVGPGVVGAAGFHHAHGTPRR